MTSPAPEPDWGDPGKYEPQSSGQRSDPPSAVAHRLDDAALDDELDSWPEPATPQRTRPVDHARGDLIDAPGQVRLLAWTFAEAARAAEMASAFAGVDPAEIEPGATGFLEARTVYDPKTERWRIAARYTAPPAATSFPDFQTWMVEWLAPTVRRPLRSGVMWCSQWWRHPEAVTRLDALWRAWEAARLEGGAGMSYWWTTHFDAHWSVLSSDRGPFAACKDKTHDGKLDMLPCDPPPENWPWPSDEEQR